MRAAAILFVLMVFVPMPAAAPLQEREQLSEDMLRFARVGPTDVVRFVSILAKAGRVRTPLPVDFPSDEPWLVRVIACRGQFVFGMYRRHMKTIRYLGQVDKLYGAPATTRNWNTMMAIVRILRGQAGVVGSSRT
jgi:hypothetical protein